MADNIALPASSGTVATDERTINSIAGLSVQRIIDIGSTAFANGQVSVSATSTSIVAARDTRKGVLITNRGVVNIFVGTGTVTTVAGYVLYPNESVSIATTAAVNGIAASGTCATHYIEEYDS